MKALFAAAACLCLGAAPLAAQQGTPAARPAGAAAAAPHAILTSPESIKWSPAPPVLPAGARAAVLDGDPSKEGPFTMRATFPDGYRIPPHFHAAHERVTVISGTFMLGMGDSFDASKLQAVPAGGYASMPPGMRHFAQARGETVVQINAQGPWSLTYVNPADDPRGKPGS